MVDDDGSGSVSGAGSLAPRGLQIEDKLRSYDIIRQGWPSTTISALDCLNLQLARRGLLTSMLGTGMF